MKKQLLINLLCAASVLTVACSHENPLEKQLPKDSGQFLFQASHFAEMKLGKDLRGAEYGQCMKGEESDADLCESLYKKMSNFSNSYHDSAFHHVTVSDLTDRNVFNRVQEYYDSAIFNQI